MKRKHMQLVRTEIGLLSSQMRYEIKCGNCAMINISVSELSFKGFNRGRRGSLC